MGKYGRLILIVSVIILLDQISKYIIVNAISLYDSMKIIPGFFDLTHLQNPGGAFSFFATKSLFIRRIFFLLFPLIALLFLFYFYKKTDQNEKWFLFSIALIMGGACGNLIDRFLKGKVVDFLDFYINGVHWPPFNIADSAICVGMFIFTICIFFSGEKLKC